MQVRLDPAFQQRIPPRADDERQRLEASREAEGGRDASVGWTPAEGEGLPLLQERMMSRPGYATRLLAAVGIGWFVWVCLWAMDADARPCGHGIAPCGCGATVVANYDMPGHLSCGTGTGLNIASGVYVNGHGFTLSCGVGSDNACVRFSGVHGALVQGLHVVGGRVGVRFLHGAYNNGFAGYDDVNRVLVQRAGNAGEGYGIDMTAGSTGNIIQFVNVGDNADEGIHISSPGGNVLLNVSLWGNPREQLYLLNSHGNYIRWVTTKGGTTGVYVKDSSTNYLWNISTYFSPFLLDGDSDGNYIRYGLTYDTLLQLRGSSASVRPENNAMHQMQFRNPGGTCARFDQAQSNDIYASEFPACGTDAECTIAGANSLTRNLGVDHIGQGAGCQLVVR
jgi:hypothetical protein